MNTHFSKIIHTWAVAHERMLYLYSLGKCKPEQQWDTTSYWMDTTNTNTNTNTNNKYNRNRKLSLQMYWMDNNNNNGKTETEN